MADRAERTKQRDVRNRADALLDAAEVLLISDGLEQISSRAVENQAGLTHGSIRYHFGSMEGLLVAVVDRATDSITDRQRAMYESDMPFREKWAQAMRWFEEDLASGYPKLVAELSAAAWNHPPCRDGIRRTTQQWADVLSDAVAGACREYGIDADESFIRGMGAIISTQQYGMMLRVLAGADVDHDHLLSTVDHILDLLENRAANDRRTP